MRAGLFGRPNSDGSHSEILGCFNSQTFDSPTQTAEGLLSVGFEIKCWFWREISLSLSLTICEFNL